MSKTSKQFIGALGENMAVKHLLRNGYKIIDRNFRKPWGEIDIVASKGAVVHFVEVKSASIVGNVISDRVDPENNVDYRKLKKLSSVVQTYLGYKKMKSDQEWQIDIAAVFIDLQNKKARIRFTEDV